MIQQINIRPKSPRHRLMVLSIALVLHFAATASAANTAGTVSSETDTPSNQPNTSNNKKEAPSNLEIERRELLNKRDELLAAANKAEQAQHDNQYRFTGEVNLMEKRLSLRLAALSTSKNLLAIENKLLEIDKRLWKQNDASLGTEFNAFTTANASPNVTQNLSQKQKLENELKIFQAMLSIAPVAWQKRMIEDDEAFLNSKAKRLSLQEQDLQLQTEIYSLQQKRDKAPLGQQKQLTATIRQLQDKREQISVKQITVPDIFRRTNYNLSDEQVQAIRGRCIQLQQKIQALSGQNEASK